MTQTEFLQRFVASLSDVFGLTFLSPMCSAVFLLLLPTPHVTASALCLFFAVFFSGWNSTTCVCLGALSLIKPFLLLSWSNSNIISSFHFYHFYFGKESFFFRLELKNFKLKCQYLFIKYPIYKFAIAVKSYTQFVHPLQMYPLPFVVHAYNSRLWILAR